MQGSIQALAIALLVVTAPANAFDARGADIIGLRLGMSSDDAVTILGQQGFPATRHDDALVARTRDGDLTIEVAGGRVREIRYVFRAAGAGEPDKIPASVLDRFGAPNQQKPMTWCQLNLRDGKCLIGAAKLIFFPETLTLILHGGAHGQP